MLIFNVLAIIKSMTKIQSQLFAMQDEKYRKFQSRLIPNVAPEKIIGIRIPVLRNFAKEIFGTKSAEEFLETLPHKFYDENNLHTFLIARIKNFESCVVAVKKFLPYIDNWATCDILRPAIFKSHKEQLLPHIKKWISSTDVYAVRFGIGMLMSHFLDEDFDEKYLAAVAKICSEEYYIKMMQAWFFATALTKQYDAARKFIEQKKLQPWTHNKAIQKANESRAIPAEHKEYLRGLRI